MESVSGLSLHGAKVLELQYVSITGSPPDPGVVPLPGLTLSQRLKAEVEYLWPGIWVRGSFDDNPLFPQYMLQVDTANASIVLGEVETKQLSPPLSSVSLPITGVQGAMIWKNAAFFLAAGHPQVVHKTETFLFHPTIRVYRTARAPLLPDTEVVQLDNLRLKAGVDYLIDYNTGTITLLDVWPEALRLTISYQVVDSTPGKKPLIQGFRTEYGGESLRWGFTHLSRRESAHEFSTGYFPFWSGYSTTPYAATQTWSALSLEKVPKGPEPHFAAEIWHRASHAFPLENRVVEDMETHTLRQPLFAMLSDPHSWSLSRASGTSRLALERVSGWLPTEGVTRSALKLDFILEGSGASVEARLVAPSPVRLDKETNLLLTLGLSQPLPGIKLEVRLLSGASGFFRQYISLGNLVGWQDVVLSGGQWEKNGLPAWERITGVEIGLVNLLPGEVSGQVILSALDIGTASRAISRWRPITSQGVMELEDVPLSIAPWSPPSNNTALAVTVKHSSPDARLPQVLGCVPRSFSPVDAEYLTFWAHAPLSGAKLTIWLLDSEQEAAGPVEFELSPGWQKYQLDLSKPQDQLKGREITAIALTILPPPGCDSLTIILDEWLLEGTQSVEGYMGRFTVAQEKGGIWWRVSGSTQTKEFQWDVPGRTSDLPYPHHLGLEARFQRPGNKSTQISINQLGMDHGETSLWLEADVWEGTVVEGQISIPNGSPSSIRDTESGAAAPSGHLRLESQLNTGSLAIAAWQKEAPPIISEPMASSTRRGLSLKAEKELPSGHLQMGGWQLAEGPSGQTIAGDFSLQLSNSLPISTAFWLLRYQDAPKAPAELGGLGRIEATYLSPQRTRQVTGRWEEMVGRERQTHSGLEMYKEDSLLTAIFNLATGLSPEDEASPRLWRQTKGISWQWHPARETALAGHWKQEAATHLSTSEASLTNTGSISLSWPLSSRWRGQGTVNWYQSEDLQSSLSTVEYSLAGEGTWLEQWTGGLVMSQRQIKMDEPGFTPREDSQFHGQRWLLSGHTHYAYGPGGSVGLAMTLAHQFGISSPALGSDSYHPQGFLPGNLDSPDSQGYRWIDEIDLAAFGSSGGFRDLAGMEDGAGTYWEGMIRWLLVRDAVYRLDLGTSTFIPCPSAAPTTTYYARAAWEKDWGALGTSSVQLSAGAGSRPGLSLGLGWTKPAAFGQAGLFWQASINHVQQEDYHFTGTRLGLEYRF